MESFGYHSAHSGMQSLRWDRAQPATITNLILLKFKEVSNVMIIMMMGDIVSLYVNSL